MENFGQVHYASGRWVITCEPHVRARLKRVFPRAPIQAANHIELSDTPENTRDLEWFLQRYPMTVDQPDVLTRRADEHRDQEARIADLLAARTALPPIELAHPPREYQVFAASMLEVKRGLLLADDVGLGKTCSAICGMASGVNMPALVVCPAHMPRQWAAQLAKFAPQLRVHILRKGQPYELIRGPQRRQPDLWPDRLPDVIISSYHKLRGWAETLAGVVRYVIFDECQALRSPSTLIYAAAKHVSLKAERRIGLSATPIYNYGSEFFWVVDALLPGALGTRDEFVREWCSSNFSSDKARIADTVQFGAYLRREGIMLRRTRADVGRELPELTKVPHTVDADAKVLDELKGDAIALAKIVLRHNEQFRGQKMQAAGELDAIIRQATGLAKAPYVAEFVRLLVENGEQVVLFGWHRAVYDIWLERLKDLDPVLYTGTESANQKDAALQAFIRGDAKVLIMSLRSGAGVDGLQGMCRTVVFGELDWSPGVHEQCVGRVHRDGQGALPVDTLKWAAQAVCAFDWLDNDDDAVAAIERLRRALRNFVSSTAGAEPAKGNAVIAGRVEVVLDEDDTFKHDLGLVIVFDSPEAIRKALASGECRFTFGAAAQEGKAS